LSGIHATDLGAISLNALVERSGIEGSIVEDVIMGCVTQAGEQSNHVGRNCVLASSLPDSVPAVTIDRQCGSSQQAVHFAAQGVMSGTQDVVIAAGVESMTRAPMGSATLLDQGKDPLSDDEYAVNSHQKATAARDAKAFENELVPVDVTLEDGTSVCHDADEGIRSDASTSALAGLNPIIGGGAITAGNASQICDGSSAVLVVSERALKEYSLEPLARIVNLTVTAGDPVIMLEEPLFATDKALQRAGMSIDDVKAQRQRRCNCARSPARRYRSETDGHADPCTADPQAALRSADDVRRRWHRQRNHHRGSLNP